MWGYNSQKYLVALETIANMVVWDACFGEVVAPWIQGPEHNVCMFLSDPCAHGVRSLGRPVCPSLRELFETL